VVATILGGGAGYVNVQGVQEHLITRIEYWSRGTSLIIVLCYVVLEFVNNRLSFFKCKVYLLYEFQDTFQLRLLLIRPKPHLQKVSSIKKKERLLYQRVHIVIVLELY